MKKVLLIPLMFVFAAVLVSAASVGTFLIYDETSEYSLTIINGDNVGVTVTADSVLEANMTIMVDLLDSSGNVIENLLDAYTTEDFYYNHLTLNPPTYGNPGDYTIISTVTAASGQIATEELSLTVLPVTPANRVPVITSTAPSQVNENTLYQYQVTATDADVNDVLTYSLSQNTGWLTINADTGLISGTAPSVDSDYQFVATVNVSDGKDFVLQVFTIDVLNVVSPPINNPPVAQNQSVTTAENTAVTIQLVATDADGNTLTYSLVGNPSNGALSTFNSATGTVTYTPNSGFTGSDSFIFRAYDGTNYSNAARVSITINPAGTGNSAPVITSTPITTVNESAAYSYDIEAIDADGDALTYSFSGPGWLSIDFSTGLLSGTAPSVSANTNYDITVIADDGNSGIATQTYVLTVVNVVSPPANNLPVITSTPVVSVNENNTYNYDVNATDADGDSLTYSISGPSWLSINPTTGLVSGTAPGVSADTPYSITVIVDDGNGGTDSQTYTLTINNAQSTTGRGVGGGSGTKFLAGQEFEEGQYLNQFAPINAAEEETPTTEKKASLLKALLVLFWIIVFILFVILVVLLVRRLRK